MNRDKVKGKAKDVAGRVERQAGEWSGSERHQVKGAAKQAEGKLQHTLGKARERLERSENRRDREDRP
jgi:uncharacterized protein YjbJ (UPF0337 family)